MIEDIAVKFLGLEEPVIKLIFYVFLVTGAVIARILNRSKSELPRAPYLFFIAATTFGYALVESMWLQMIPAIVGGYVWVLVTIDLLAATLSGYFYGRAAMARSRDAYGHSRNAVLAFIPFANFVLLFKRSRSDLSAERVATLPVMTGGLGVFFGLLLLASTLLLSRALDRELEHRIDQMSADPATEHVALEFAIKANGIDAMLTEIADRAQTPTVIDAEMTLERIRADGSVLRRIFVISSDSFTLTDDYRSAINQEICSSQLFVTLMSYGASVREEYAREDGSEIGSHTVTWSICAAMAA